MRSLTSFAEAADAAEALGLPTGAGSGRPRGSTRPPRLSIRGLRSGVGRRNRRGQVQFAQRPRRVPGQSCLRPPPDNRSPRRMGPASSTRRIGRAPGLAGGDRHPRTQRGRPGRRSRYSTCRTWIRWPHSTAPWLSKSCQRWTPSRGSPIPRSITTPSSTTNSWDDGWPSWPDRRSSSTRPTGSAPMTWSGCEETSNST